VLRVEFEYGLHEILSSQVKLMPNSDSTQLNSKPCLTRSARALQVELH